MIRDDYIRFAVWAGSHRDKGANLTIENVLDYCPMSRATAYRLIAAYFDAMGWQWPRIDMPFHRQRKPPITRAARYAAFNRPTPQR